jgi:uncharacterized protein YacL
MILLILGTASVGFSFVGDLNFLNPSGKYNLSVHKNDSLKLGGGLFLLIIFIIINIIIVEPIRTKNESLEPKSVESP